MNKILESLKENPDCLYIYNQGFSIYGLPEDNPSYIVIVKDTWEIPKDWIDVQIKEFVEYNQLTIDHIVFDVYTITKWFEKVVNGDLICWICACMNKKFIIKEHVKLMMQTDILQLRREFDAELDPMFLYGDNLLYKGEIQEGKEILWRLIRDLKFINQIYESHKIVNFKEANLDWNKINQCDDPIQITSAWLNCSVEPIKLLRSRTDDILRESKIKNALKNE